MTINDTINDIYGNSTEITIDTDAMKADVTITLPAKPARRTKKAPMTVAVLLDTFALLAKKNANLGDRKYAAVRSMIDSFDHLDAGAAGDLFTHYQSCFRFACLKIQKESQR